MDADTFYITELGYSTEQIKEMKEKDPIGYYRTFKAIKGLSRHCKSVCRSFNPNAFTKL